MYQYANELACKGYKITIYHAIKKFEKKSFVPSYIKKVIYKLRGVEKPVWFNLHPSIVSKIVTEINDGNIDDADIVFSTWWSVAYLVNGLSASKGRKFNLIQGYEIWKGNKDLVHSSYRLEIHHIVISKYLISLIEKISGRKPLYLPNAIDFEKFHIVVPPQERNRASICMLYSSDIIKGTSFGLKALMEVKELVPELVVELFSIFRDPGNLPAWISFRHKPNDLVGLYNRNAIFLSPSLTEGWALPPAEAMASGCAVICTDIGGHHDYAIDGQTALLVKPEDHNSIKSALLKVITNNSLRLGIANKGNAYLNENFNLKRSASMLEDYFEK